MPFINDIATAVPAGQPPHRTGGDASPTTEQRMARFEAEATALATTAVRHLAERHDLSRVTHLLIVTNTGFFAPGIDYHVIETFALDRRVARLQLGFTGAAASLDALGVARKILAAAPDAVVLIVIVELPTLHVLPDDEARTVPFGNGAAAALVSAAPEGIALTGGGHTLVPSTREVLGMAVGTHGFRFSMSETGFDTIKRNLPVVADQAGLAAPFRDRAAIVSCAVPELADAVADILEIDTEQRRLEAQVSAEAGNLLSAGTLFAFGRALTNGNRTSKLAALAIAPGIGLRWCLGDIRP